MGAPADRRGSEGVVVVVIGRLAFFDLAHVLIGEPASTPDQLGGGLSPHHALRAGSWWRCRKPGAHTSARRANGAKQKYRRSTMEIRGQLQCKALRGREKRRR